MRTLIYESPDRLAEGAAEFIGAALLAADGPVTLGLAGGGTPRATYERLRGADVPWPLVTAWLGDERWVAPDHPDSNARMAADALLDHVDAQLVVPDRSQGDPGAAALAYEAELARVFVSRGGSPAPDVVLLGVGDDGHTASLFPETGALAVRDRSYVANWVDAKGAWRLTATFPLLWSARHVVFIVSGVAKAGIIRSILDDGVPYPAQVAAAGAADVLWLLDAAAASQLRATPR